MRVILSLPVITERFGPHRDEEIVLKKDIETDIIPRVGDIISDNISDRGKNVSKVILDYDNNQCIVELSSYETDATTLSELENEVGILLSNNKSWYK